MYHTPVYGILLLQQGGASSSFLVTLFRVRFFICNLPYGSYLAQLGISVHCQVSVRPQYLVRLLS